jgi:phosphatidylglycerophosphate synthase
MAGLLAYPLLLEPTLSLEGQRGAFLVIVALVVVTIAAIGVALRRTPAEHSLPVETQAAVGAAWSFDWRTVILLTAIPSSLLLGVTSYLLTDVASLPLFWVIPLVLYLTTFIVAFGTRWPHLPAWLSRW